MNQALVALLLLVQGPTIPPPRGLVNDFAGVVTAESQAKIERIAEEVRTKSRGEMAIVTLADLEGRDPSDIALRIGREWKVGKLGDPGDATRNAGAVILLVPKESSADGRGYCRVETGSGTEGFITDATAGEICREATPFFVQRDYSRGLELITLRVAERFAAEFGFALDTSTTNLAPQLPATAPTGGGGGGSRINPVFIFILIIFIISITSRGRRGRRRGVFIPPIILGGGGRGWGGGGWGGGGSFGGGGGGFGGFGGGGGFSGGGGGSSW